MQLLSVLVILFCSLACNADVAGVYYWSWSGSGVNVSYTNLDVAFSGWVDSDQAISESASVLPHLQGDKYISIGGGNANGRWTANFVNKVASYCSNNKFSAYHGVVFDVEEGDSGLSSAFANAFAACKSRGFKVLVTVSGSAPYGINDAAALMQSFFPNKNIDYLSPQLYASGNEKSNDYGTNAGVQYTEWAKSVPQVIPSIVSANLYADARSVFQSRFGVKTAGYVRWSQQG